MVRGCGHSFCVVVVMMVYLKIVIFKYTACVSVPFLYIPNVHSLLILLSSHVKRGS